MTKPKYLQVILTEKKDQDNFKKAKRIFEDTLDAEYSNSFFAERLVIEGSELIIQKAKEKLGVNNDS